MTREEVIEEYGNANTLCHIVCDHCNHDEYCPSDCDITDWVRHNYDKAVDKLAKCDGDICYLMKSVIRKVRYN